MSDYRRRKPGSSTHTHKNLDTIRQPGRNKYYILASILGSSILTFLGVQYINTPQESPKFQQEIVREIQTVGEPPQEASKTAPQHTGKKTLPSTNGQNIGQSSNTEVKTGSPKQSAQTAQVKTGAKRDQTKVAIQKKPPKAEKSRTQSSVNKVQAVGARNITTKPSNTKPLNNEQLPEETQQIQITKRTQTAENPYLAQQTLKAAIKLLKRNEVNKAEEYLLTALKFDPSNIDARETLAGVYTKKQRHEKLIALLQEGLIQNPDHFKFRLLLAQSYLDADNEKQALDLLLDSPDPQKKTGEYHSMIAAIQQNLSMFNDAIDSYKAALTIQPNEGRWWLGLGLAYEYSEQFKEAEVAYLRATKSGNLDKQLQHFITERLRVVKLYNS